MATVGVLALLLAAAVRGVPFPDGPPAAVTGGFGEDSCLACHFDNGLNEPGGSLVLAGLPDSYEPGGSYTLSLALERSGLRSAGFQLSARLADGRQAGTLTAGPSDENRVGVLEHRAIQYIQHELNGVAPTSPGASAWSMVWTAPDSGGPVTFHAAAVAGDHDESQTGDFVYTLERELRPTSSLQRRK